MSKNNSRLSNANGGSRSKKAKCDGNPVVETKRKGSKHSCSFSICPCNEVNCHLKSVSREPLRSVWVQFLKDNDPVDRNLSRIQLCDCHFDDCNWTKPILSPMLENAIKMLRKQNQELNKIKTGLRELFTEDQINCIIDKKNHTHYNHETMIKAVDLSEKIGMKSYNYLITIGFPFPHDRTIRGFKAKLHDGVDGDVLQAVTNADEDSGANNRPRVEVPQEQLADDDLDQIDNSSERLITSDYVNESVQVIEDVVDVQDILINQSQDSFQSDDQPHFVAVVSDEEDGRDELIMAGDSGSLAATLLSFSQGQP